MKIAGVIPARYGSSRFPGKPFAELLGKPMLWHVFSQARKARLLDSLWVATESEQVAELCRRFSFPCLMTDPGHQTPTSRLGEAAGMVEADLYVMIGGDEPLITGEDVDLIIRAARRKLAASSSPLLVVNAMAPVASPAEALDPANIKVACREDGLGLYASRSPIPYPMGELNFDYKKFASIGAYTKPCLDFFCSAPPGVLEHIECCDLLRFMEQGIPVYFTDTGHPLLSVDTKKDLAQAERLLLSVSPSQTG